MNKGLEDDMGKRTRGLEQILLFIFHKFNETTDIIQFLLSAVACTNKNKTRSWALRNLQSSERERQIYKQLQCKTDYCDKKSLEIQRAPRDGTRERLSHTIQAQAIEQHLGMELIYYVIRRLFLVRKKSSAVVRRFIG